MHTMFPHTRETANRNQSNSALRPSRCALFVSLFLPVHQWTCLHICLSSVIMRRHQQQSKSHLDRNGLFFGILFAYSYHFSVDIPFSGRFFRIFIWFTSLIPVFIEIVSVCVSALNAFAIAAEDIRDRIEIVPVNRTPFASPPMCGVLRSPYRSVNQRRWPQPRRTKSSVIRRMTVHHIEYIWMNSIFLNLSGRCCARRRPNVTKRRITPEPIKAGEEPVNAHADHCAHIFHSSI